MKNVKMYSTTWCHFCKMAKNFFEENDIKYEEVNVEEDDQAAEEMVQKSGQTGVPVIEIGDSIIIGFDKTAIKKELGMK